MNAPSPESVGRLIRIGADIVEGRLPNPADIAWAIAGLALEFAPEEDLHKYLTDQARARADAIAAAAEVAKFGG